MTSLYSLDPAVLMRPLGTLNPKEVLDTLGVDRMQSMQARDLKWTWTKSVFAFQFTAVPNTWCFIVALEDGQLAVEAGRYVLGGRFDGAWLRICSYDELSLEQLPIVVGDCFDELTGEGHTASTGGAA